MKRQLLISFLLILSTAAQLSPIKLDSGTNFSIKYLKASEELQIQATVPKNMYMALGFGDMMKNSDMVIFQAKGPKGEVNDVWSKGHKRTYFDKSQDYKWTSKVVGNNYLFTATRKLDTGDAEEDVVVPKDMLVGMMWSVNKNSPELGYHSSRGFLSFKIDSKTEAVTVKKEQLSTWPKSWPANLKKSGSGFNWVLHGILMWVSWFIFGITMIGLNRWFMYLSDWNQQIHAVMGWMITIVTLWSGISAMIHKEFDFGNGLHDKFGIILVLGILFVSFSGVYAFISKAEIKWNTNGVLGARKIHRRLGLVFFILSFLALTTGLGHFLNQEKNKKYKFLFPIHAIGMLLITIGNEVLFRWKRKQEDKLVAPDRIITEDEFEKMVKDGQKLCILDDIVLNLETYADMHPGGAFLINYTVGRDVSKFFFGSYTLDGN